MQPDWLCDMLSGELRGCRRVLDLGCGTGQYALCIAKKIRARVVGVDVSRQAVGRARKRFERHAMDGRADFRHADAASGKALAQGERFDGVMVVYALHHFADPRGALREARHRLAPGGRLVIADLALPEAKRSYGCHTMRVSEVWALLEEAGFRGIHAELLEPGFALYTACTHWPR